LDGRLIHEIGVGPFMLASPRRRPVVFIYKPCLQSVNTSYAVFKIQSARLHVVRASKSSMKKITSSLPFKREQPPGKPKPEDEYNQKNSLSKARRFVEGCAAASGSRSKRSDHVAAPRRTLLVLGRSWRTPPGCDTSLDRINKARGAGVRAGCVIRQAPRNARSLDPPSSRAGP
jgi:hypothetical protein